MKQSKPDIRLLTLKKWNLPHTASICDVPASYGEYVSFQDYHFIDIQNIDPQNSEAMVFGAVYDQLKCNRSTQCMQREPMDIHTIQSMTLIGESTDFWENSPQVLYITLIQLVNCSIVDMTSLKRNILQTINAVANSKDTVRCALYESLDFCDLVLFTTGIKLDALQRCLWNMTPIRRRQNYCYIRDTFSFCCFNRASLQKVFAGNPNEIQWDDTVSFSVDLSIQNLTHWHTTKRELKSVHPFTVARTLGRHDVRLTFSNLSGAVSLQVLRKLDSACQQGKAESDTGFGSYHVTILSKQLQSNTSGTRAAVDTTLYEVTLQAMRQWHIKQRKPAFNGVRDYIEETFSAILTLAKSGFSDEFVISVLPSLQVFIRLIDELYDANEQINGKDLQPFFAEKIMPIQQIYFRALNTLALCTMHNERQFIQSPAFHATYFDVPPKLLAFYNALADDIAQVMAPPSNEMYSFILVPDYGNDIVVTSLEVETSRDLGTHLAVVTLHESLFYDPVKAIGVLCHESAHYQGNRLRASRAKYIFQAIGIYLLKLASPFVNSAPDWQLQGSLLELLSQGFCDQMKDLLDKKDCGARKGIPYILQGIADFLDETDYGLLLFREPRYSMALLGNWKQKLLLKLCDEKDAVIQAEFKRVTGALDESWSSTIFADSQPGWEYKVDVFLRFLLSDLAHIEKEWALEKTLTDTDSLQEFTKSCQNIIQAFSEAYADLQMLRLLGNSLTLPMYGRFLKIDTYRENTQLLLRYNAVCLSGLFGTDTAAPKTIDKRIEVYEIIQDLLAAYLQDILNAVSCNETKQKKLQTIYQTFLNGSPLDQVMVIRNKLSEYRQSLVN